jgi:hypothetical protein
MTIEDVSWEETVNTRFAHLLPKNESKTVKTVSVVSKMKEHNPDKGGLFSIIVGSTGAGKTGTMFYCLIDNIRRYPNEFVFLSECYNAPLQFTKLPKDKVNIMVQNDCCRFVDRVKKKPCVPEHTVFTDYADCYNKAKRGKINVLFLEDRKDLMEFISWTVLNAMEWVTFGIDELSEIVPSYSSGNVYRRIEKFSWVLKDCRKSDVNIIATVQSAPLVDFKCLHMKQILIYMPGSMQYKHSRVFQSALDSLQEDEIKGNPAIVEGYNRYVRTRINTIYKPDYSNMMHAVLKEKKE